jgi:Raf kinase inhibitor-like YbhB/YbcL family protein
LTATTIPEKYARYGKDISPPLEWSDPPDNTQSFALIAVCGPLPDGGGNWVHWALYNIPAEARALPEAATPDETGKMPDGSQHLENSWGELRYGGPNPQHFATQRCYFRIYALDTTLAAADIDAAAAGQWIGASEEKLLLVIEGHVLAKGELMGKIKGK